MTRAQRDQWTVFEMERDEDGRDDGAIFIKSYWHESEARSECNRLSAMCVDESRHYVVIKNEVSVVYPSDESPPWVPHPDRLKKRGWEDPASS